MSARGIAGIAAGLAALGAVVAAAVGFGGGGVGAVPDGPAAAPATGEVTRATLVDRKSVAGTLGYGPERGVSATVAGLVTWLPAPGSTVARGQPLFRVNEVAVPLLYGELPLYRRLEPGVTGPDVLQFEQNLRALGHTGFEVDSRYTATTAAAVGRWQAGLGLAKTGTLEPGQAVYRPGPVRVARHARQVGDEATGELYTATGTAPLVTVELDTADRRLAGPGTAVTVVLPTGTGAPGGAGGAGGAGATNVTGSVADVVAAPAASDAAGAPAAGGQSTEPKVTVTIRLELDGGSATDRLDGTPVQVQLVTEQRADVLTVPVEALLALAGGGYGVQVVDGATSRLVPVEIGMFADGRVEIRGAGLAEHLTVGVPR